MNRIRNYKWFPNMSNCKLYQWQLHVGKGLKVSLSVVMATLALVNCTIGPSSDTTWFPTWMKGILPREGKKYSRRSRPLNISWRSYCSANNHQTQRAMSSAVRVFSSSKRFTSIYKTWIQSNGTDQTTKTEKHGISECLAIFEPATVCLVLACV